MLHLLTVMTVKARCMKTQASEGLMWLKAYITFSGTRAGRVVWMLQESERDINDDWQDGGEGATDWEEKKNQELIIFRFSLRMADKADQRRISSGCSALRAHHQKFPLQIHLCGS